MEAETAACLEGAHSLKGVPFCLGRGCQQQLCLAAPETLPLKASFCPFWRGSSPSHQMDAVGRGPGKQPPPPWGSLPGRLPWKRPGMPVPCVQPSPPRGALGDARQTAALLLTSQRAAA